MEKVVFNIIWDSAPPMVEVSAKLALDLNGNGAVKVLSIVVRVAVNNPKALVNHHFDEKTVNPII